MDGGVVLVDQANEDVNGINKEVIGFAPVLMADGRDDVTREFTVGSGWAGRQRVRGDVGDIIGRRNEG